MAYTAPIREIRFVMDSIANLADIARLPGCEDASSETIDAILDEAAHFCGSVIAPLNRGSDQHPSAYKGNGQVATPKGFKEAFAQFGQGGWQGLHFPSAYGGQGLPKTVATASMEMLNSASLSFALCPLLTDGAVEALLLVGTPEQRNTYLPHLIAGRWTGTMNLTEAQAGSDLAQVNTRAIPQPDGSFRLFGQKIFITYGEHDMAENIIHLVLGRTPDAPPGVKGISLFIVPKYIPTADGKPGTRNDVYCPSIEHKLGIHGSPTAVLLYGDGHGELGEGAVGYLVGEQNRGLEYMFIMMNAARFAVGVQGVAVAERAYQQAVAYARDRVQGRAVEGSAQPVSIIHHPDIRRMLLTMRAYTEGARALAYATASASDYAHHHPETEERRLFQNQYEYQVPLLKGFATEMSLEVTSLGVQVHGGMGFIEETGAAQHYRDARILTIYEGTTAIQANDFVGRKTLRDKGETASWFFQQIQLTLRELQQSELAHTVAIAHPLYEALTAYQETTQFILESTKGDIRATYAGSVPYLKLAGNTLAGWYMARQALVATKQMKEGNTDPFLSNKIITARFYAEHILSLVPALAKNVRLGADSLLALPIEQF